MVATRRTTATEMAEFLVSRILNNLRQYVTEFARDGHAWARNYSMHIRDGVPHIYYEKTWNDCRNEIRHHEPGEVVSKVKEIESLLRRSLISHLHHGFHGQIEMTATLKDKTLSYSFEITVQHKLEWIGIGRTG